MSPADSPEPGDGPPGAVLFVCGMNAVRSPMAEALARHLFPSGLYVASAGVHSGELDPFAASVMEEMGLSIAAHHPQTLEELADTSFDLIVTLAPEAHHQALELTRTMAVEVEYWPTEDPTLTGGSRAQRLDAYRRVRDGLLARLKRRFGWRATASG